MSSEHLNHFAASDLGFHPSPQAASGFDFFVLLAGIALLLLRRSLRLGNRDKSRIDVLTTTGLETLGTEVSLKHLKELFDHSRLAQPLPEEGNYSGISNAIHHTKPDKFLKRASVIHLEFKLFIAQIEKLLENEYHEKDQRINPLSPRIAFALVLIALVKQLAE